ncbi:hypothetical protein GLOIN_2v1617465, partial [Rhizophagus irregularis DAOM 181602=DAOM 197198]
MRGNRDGEGFSFKIYVGGIGFFIIDIKFSSQSILMRGNRDGERFYFNVFIKIGVVVFFH